MTFFKNRDIKMITPIYAALLTPVLVYLILRIVMLRFKHRVSLGDGGNADLNQAIRAHGNFIETTPWVLLLMVLLDIQGGDERVMHMVGILLLVGRLMHFYAITQDKIKFRSMGMIATILAMIMAAIYNMLLVVLINVNA